MIFGEHSGSYCILASFKNGSKEKYCNKMEDPVFKPNDLLHQCEVPRLMHGVNGIPNWSECRSSQYMDLVNQHYNFPQAIAMYRASPTLPCFMPNLPRRHIVSSPFSDAPNSGFLNRRFLVLETGR
ncbi:hypothetical protein CHUAL_000464 [Chamberlinius hualienensis]